MSKRASPPRRYFVTVAPANPLPFDEGMSLKVLLPARRSQNCDAARAPLRPRKKILTSVQLVQWTSEAPR